MSFSDTQASETLSVSPDIAHEARPGEVREFSLPEALELAARLLRGKHLDECEQVCAAVLQNWPDQPDAVHYAGVLRHLQGENEEAVNLLAHAIHLMPANPAPYNNLGNVLAKVGRIDDAMSAFRQSIELAGETPEAADAYNNLGRMHRKRDELPQAEQACRHAIALRPDAVDGWYNLSVVLVKQGKVHEGILANSKAIALWPRHHQPRENVIRALVLLGELDEAAKLYREWLAEEPDNPVIAHHLAACERGEVPERASDGYVEKVFDGFANSFDEKLKSLDYHAPEFVTKALAEVAGEPKGALDIVDAGCGTGWCGPMIKPWAKTLVGCDLSQRMLDKAKPRGAYDVLAKAELTQFLEERSASCDVIISADTLCYFGDLHRVSHAALMALRSGGWLIYTVEAWLDDDMQPFVLQTHGRYAHARPHVEATVRAAGFAEQRVQGVVLRSEAGKDVKGWLVSARAPA